MEEEEGNGAATPPMEEEEGNGAATPPLEPRWHELLEGRRHACGSSLHSYELRGQL